MTIPVVESVRQILVAQGIEVADLTPVSGGDISASFRLRDREGRTFFIKSDESALVRAEQLGLATLADADHPLVVPEPVALLPLGERQAVLIMEWLDGRPPDPVHSEQLGQGLAQLHTNASESYGFREDNYIGRLPQLNGPCENWIDFFLTRRIEPQVRWAHDRGNWSPGWRALYRNLEARLQGLIPERPQASLVHGDLWGGNAMATVRGPAIVDPAVHYAHREVDLAMTELFGGFSPAFYAAYTEAFPLEGGYEDRRDLYNLYHLLNHLNLFGSGYAGSVDRILRRYGS